VCEQLAQNRYLAALRFEVEPATSGLQFWHATVAPASRARLKSAYFPFMAAYFENMI